MNNKLEVIGIDHGWSMMKTISQVFVTGVKEITTTPALFGDVLEYEGKFYKVGTVRQEVKDTKVEDDSFYLLTLAAVAKELKRRGLAEAKVFLAVGLPLTRFGAEKNDFIKYLTKNKRVSFKYENESYHIEIDDVAVFPQCYAAVVDKIPTMAKKTLIVDIGSWTIDIMPVINKSPDESKCVTIPKGLITCMRSINEQCVRQLNGEVDESEIQNIMRYGRSDIDDEYFAIIKAEIEDFVDKVYNSIREFGYNLKTILSNPPFGREWKNEKAKVEEEAKLGFGGRFGAGLPAASDGQMLFLMTAISKMKDIDKGGSRIAIIHNGSPLFTGDAGSGPSEIRRYILENDLLEAIVALPNDIFYNTGIATYIWVLSNKKAGTVREGKVQLINANEMFVKRRKALGNKRNDISEDDITEITKIYGDFKESEISQIYDNEDFGYTKITVERPLRDEEGNLVLKKGKKQPDTSLRDTENVPLKEDIKEYFEREVLPFAPDAWIDTKKSKVGYEIPFTRYFYKYEAPRPSAEIMAEIMDLETELSGSLEEVFDL